MPVTGGSLSSGTSTSTSVPGSINSPQSDWSLELAQYLQQIGQEQMAWAMQEYARAGSVTDAQINNYISTAQQGSDLAGGMLGRYNDLYAPMTDQYAREAGTYASNGRLQHEMGRAESGVMQAGRQAELNAEQELQSYGIDPSSGRYQDLVRASNTANAAAAVNAGETARRQVEQEGTRRKETAINMGQQLPGAAVNSLNSAYQGIAGAENAALGLANTGVNLTTSPSKFFDPAMSLKYPPVGNTSQSGSQQRASSGPSGGGASPGKTSDPFNSDRYGRASQDPGGGARPTGGYDPNGPGNRAINPLYQSFAPGALPRDQESDTGQAPGGDVNPSQWNSFGAQHDPYSWGASDADQGITPTPQATQLGNPNDPWGGTPQAPADWGNATNGAAQPGGWWDQNSQANWPTTQPADRDPYADYYSQQPQGNDNSGWNTSGQNLGGWENGSLNNFNTGSSQADWGDEYAEGGGVVPAHMSPSGGQQVDDVQANIPQTGGKAQLNVDEFVIPRDVALWKGQEYFQKMIAQSRKARMGAPAKPQRGQ